MSAAVTMSHAERLLWATEMDASAPAFLQCPRHLTIAAWLRGPLDVQRLTAAVRAVVATHEVLRSSYSNHGANVSRTVHREAELVVQFIDVSLVPEADRHAAAVRLLEQAANEPFDLTCGPLYRSTLAKVAAAEHAFALTVHHLVLDAWSADVVAREIGETYRALSRGIERNGSRVCCAYRQYVEMQDAAVRQHSADVDAWIEMLLEASGRAPARQRGDGPALGRQHDIAIPPDRLSDLRQLAGARGSTLSMAMIALFGQLLRATTGEREVHIGIPLVDRPRREFESAVGLFMNALVVVVDAADTDPAEEAFHRVRRQVFDGYSRSYLSYPFALLSTARLWESPPVRHVVSCVTTPPRVLDMGDVASAPIDLRTDRLSPADLSLHLRDDGKSVRCFFVFHPAAFTETDVAAMARLLVERIARTCDSA